MEGTPVLNRIRSTFAMMATAIFAVLAAAPCAAAEPVTLQSVRSWSSPTHTRVVFDLSSDVTPIAPDSGSSSELVIAVPGEVVRLADGVVRRLAVGDGVVDTVEILTAGNTTRFRLRFKSASEFRAFDLGQESGKPYRFVVDVMRPGGEKEEATRLARIAEKKRTDRVRIVAVDAGHGGEDTGARGASSILEKNVVLAIAKEIVKALDDIPGVKGVLTRNGDYFIPLRERYRLAERMKADVFISIHANSSARRGRGNGSEVYFLSQRGASDQAVADLADLENAADLIGGVPPQAENDLVNILYDVKRSGALKQSEVLAEALLERVVDDGRLEMRGVKQAGFVVLKSVEFPSALVEVAFINHPTEGRMLNDPAFQRQTGKKIAQGLTNYFQRAGVPLLGAAGGSTSNASP
jgi:N-acetylmuramoyl-L-alanine amidase